MMRPSVVSDAVGRWVSTLRAFIWRIGAIPYDAVVVLLAIVIVIQSRVWNIRSVRS